MGTVTTTRAVNLYQLGIELGGSPPFKVRGPVATDGVEKTIECPTVPDATLASAVAAHVADPALAAPVKVSSDERTRSLDDAARLFGRQPVGVVVSDCEQGHNWTQTEGTAGSLTADTTNVRTGTQSLRITSVNGNRVRARLQPVPDVDFAAGEYLGWWLYVDDPAKVQNFYVHAFSPGNAGIWTRHFTTPRLKQGWQFLHFGRNMSWATFDSGSITNFVGPLSGFQFRLESVAGQTASVSFDSLRLYRNELSGGLVTLMFDDSLASQFTVARPLLDAHGMRGMAFMVSDWVGTAGKMTVAQLQQLDALGWDVAAHSKTHTNLTTLTEAQVDTELASSRQFLLDNDLVRGSRFCAFPQNGWNPMVMRVARRYYSGIRGGDIDSGSSQFLPFPQTVALSSRPADTGATVADVKAWVDDAKANRTWLSVYWHEITAGGSATSPTTENGLAAILSHIAALGLPVVTYSDLQIKFPAPA